MRTRIVDAIMEVLKENGSLTYKEVYKKIIEKDLYQFGARKPENVVNGEIRCHCEGIDFPSASPVKYFKVVGTRGKDNLYALKDDKSPEVKMPPKNTIEDDMVPEEKIDLTYLFYKSSLKKAILEHIMDCDPGFFENLVVKLLLEMGYGADKLSGEVVGKPHDHGIDGIIYEDRLGLSKIYIQAKRYDAKNTVGSAELQAFCGALEGVQKGVFITTSTFTREACKYVDRLREKSIKLIDGDLLAESMIKYGIGLEKVQTYTVYKINEDFYQ